MVVISKNVLRRNILETDFWTEFTQNTKDSHIILLGEPGGEELYDKYKAENVEVIFLKKYPTSFWHKLVLFMVRTGTNTHGVKLYRWRSYQLGEAKLTMTLLKSAIANTLGRLSIYHHFVRKLYGGLSQTWVEDLYDKYKPDVVLTPSLIDLDFDAMVAAAGKRRGVKVIGMVRSWDNLIIHGLMPCVPDVFIFQNQYLKWSAENVQSINLDQIKSTIVGLPHYDDYRLPEKFLKPRDVFFKESGLDESKKLILLGGFDFYWSEDVLPAKLDQAIEQGRLGGCQVVFRPHPRTPFKMTDYNIASLKHIILNAPFLDKASAFNDKDFFINLVYHCDVLINAASTLTIDACVFDRPVICMNFDEPSKVLPKWKQVSRLYDCFDHFEALLATGCAKLPMSFEDMVKDINSYFKDPSQNRDGRKKAIEKFVAPFEGDSGQRLVREVLAEVEKV